MFSSQVGTVHRLSPRWLLTAAIALLALSGLLAAFVVVLTSQVEKANSREAQYRAVQVEISQCAARFSGSARSQCIARASAALAAFAVYAPAMDAPAFGVTAVEAGQSIGAGASR